MTTQTTTTKITFRRTAAGQWAVYGPAAQVAPYSTIHVAKKDGSIVDVEIGCTMTVDGGMAWGTINSQRPSAKPAKTTTAPWCPRCHCHAPIWRDGLCRSCHHDEIDSGN